MRQHVALPPCTSLYLSVWNNSQSERLEEPKEQRCTRVFRRISTAQEPKPRVPRHSERMFSNKQNTITF